MSKEQFGCKKCGSVLSVENRVRSSSCETTFEGANVEERSGAVEVKCKKCNNVVAAVEVKRS